MKSRKPLAKHLGRRLCCEWLEERRLLTVSVQTLYSFMGSDGTLPLANLTLVDKTLFGTTSQSGSEDKNYGNVFSIDPDKPDTSRFQILKSFDGVRSFDGIGPHAGLRLVGETLFGTTGQGGSKADGTVFSIKPDGTGFQVVYSFQGNDGKLPVSDLTLVDGALFGTTAGGGSKADGTVADGTVFSIKPNGTSFQVLHSFDLGNKSDGAFPGAGLTFGLTRDGQKKLFGTTENGGSNKGGTLFSINTDGTDFRVLHSFAGSDGTDPVADLTLMGTTLFGTTSGFSGKGDDTVFSMESDGSNFKVLHSFIDSDGAHPLAGLTAVGPTLFGTTSIGGDQNVGTVFSIKQDGSDFQVLHSFTGSDGASPGGLTLDGSKLYGATRFGGGQNKGTVFSISVTPGITINSIHQSEGNSGTSSFVFTVSLDAPTPAQVVVDYATGADGTATTLDNDYESQSGQLTFQPGETAQTITIAVNGDTKIESDETFTVNLSNAQNATIATAQGTATITNDDFPPSRFFFSTSPTSPTLNVNPTINMPAGTNASLYVFWQPSKEPDPNNPGAFRNELLSALGLDIVGSKAILSRTNYTLDNPIALGTSRWHFTNTGSSSGTSLVQGAEAISNRDFSTMDDGYDPITNTWRVATLNFTATTAGTTNIFLGVSTNGISFATNPTARDVNFGFDDPAISTAVPPATQVLTGSGLKGDMNGDGVVNDLDIPAFLLALEDPAAYLVQFAPISASERDYRGDINQDNSFNNFDLQWFYNDLTVDSPTGSPPSVSLISTTQLPDATVNVTPVNHAPRFVKGSDQSVLEDAGQVTVSGWATSSPGAADESGQVLDFQLSNNNPGLFEIQPNVDATNGTLSFKPAANANGTATVTVRLHDNGGTADGGHDLSAPQILTITVTPVNDGPSFVKGPDQTVLEDSGLSSLAGWATAISPGPADESSQTLDFQVSNNNRSLFEVQPHLDANGSLKYQPAANANGTATVTVRLHDDGGTANGGSDLSAPQSFGITVTPVNDAPSFVTGPNQIVLEDSGLTTFAGWATTSPGPGDESRQRLDFQLGSDNPGLFEVQPTLDAGGSLKFKPAADANGMATVTVRLHDDGGTADGGSDLSAPQTFTITVTPVNDAPSFVKGPDQTVFEDSGLTTLAGWATAIGSGPANESQQTLDFQLSNSNPDLFEIPPSVDAGGSLKFKPAANANGTATVTARVHDDGGTADGGSDLSAPQTFTISVLPVNDAPSFVKGPNQTVLEDSGLTTLAGWATAISPGPADESGQALDFQLINSNPGLFEIQPSVNSADGTLSFKPAPDANGTVIVSVRLHDDGGTTNGGNDLSATQTFTITVTPVNDPPSFVKGPDQIVSNQETLVTLPDWSTMISPGPPNEAGQTVDFLVTTDNDAMFSQQPKIVANGTSGTLMFEPAADAVGTATVTVTVRDSGGIADGGNNTSKPQTFTITVTDDRPTVSVDPVSQLEGNSDKTDFNFVVKLSSPSKKPVTVTYKTVDGTATSADGDYDQTNGTLVLAPGETERGAPVKVHGDGTVENDETFFVQLSHASGARLTSSPLAQGTILNDDVTPLTNASAKDSPPASALPSAPPLTLAPLVPPTQFLLPLPPEIASPPAPRTADVAGAGGGGNVPAVAITPPRLWASVPRPLRTVTGEMHQIALLTYLGDADQLTLLGVEPGDETPDDEELPQPRTFVAAAVAQRAPLELLPIEEAAAGVSSWWTLAGMLPLVGGGCAWLILGKHKNRLQRIWRRR